MSELANIHPADELAAVREEIAILEKRADELRDWLLDDANAELLKGVTCTAVITPQKRENLDKKAITEAFGEKAIAPYVKTTSYKVVKLVDNRKIA